MHLRTEPPDGRRIVPDYALPDALCVPLSNFSIRDTLEAVAAAAARRVGVILITPDPLHAGDMIAAQDHPEHFALVSGYYDSPWLRDHAPVAIRHEGRINNIRPAHAETERKHDPQLFATVFPGASGRTPQCVAGGNLVAGPDGLAVSTVSVLAENTIEEPGALAETARVLGIADWLFVPPFADDISQHTDSMLRFLSPTLAAYCDRRDQGAEVSRRMAEALSALRPEIELLPLPCTGCGAVFDSPLNWIQLEDLLLVPRYPRDDPLADARHALLEAHGFTVVPVTCETAGLGGGLHCLTASIFVSPLDGN